MPLSKIESRKRNGNYQIFEIEREISLSTLDFSLESETLVNAWNQDRANVSLLLLSVPQLLIHRERIGGGAVKVLELAVRWGED